MEINFKRSSKNESKYSNVCKYILDKEYGDVVDFKTLAKMFEIDLTEESDWKKLQNRMKQVKNILVDYGIVLKNVIGVGYYILKPKQISSYCYRTYVEKTKTLLEKSERILSHIDKTELSDIRKKEQSQMYDLNQQLYSEIGLIVEESDYGKNRNYYNSLKD